MMQLTWLFVGSMGAGSLYLALTRDNDYATVFAAVIGFLSWGMFALGASNVMVRGASSMQTYSYPALMYFGLAMAVAALFVGLEVPFDLVGEAAKGREIDELR